MAVAAGLAIGVPPAARADTTFNITVDPGSALDAPTLQQAINEWLSYGTMADAVNRTIQSNFLNISGFNGTMTASFTGSVSITSDGTGVSVNVTTGQATNLGDAFWHAGVGGLLGMILGTIMRAMCEPPVFASRPPTATWQRATAVICGAIGGLFVAFTAGFFALVLSGTPFDPTGNIQAFARAVSQGALANALWEAGIIRFIGQWILNAARGLLNMNPYPAFPPQVQAAVTTTATDLEQFATAWDEDADSLAGQSFSVDASSPPCDIYGYYGTPCADAYSTTRALRSSYGGPLYEVQRASDLATADIYPVSAGGAADAAAQDAFCANTTCTIIKLYDQSADWDDLTVPSGDRPAYATALPVQVGGSTVYGVDVTPGVGYRDNAAINTAIDGDAEGMYMVTSGTNVNSGCCFDFGNAETNGQDMGQGHMDAVNFGTWCGPNSTPCTGSGPWVEADMENGQWMGNGPNPANTGISSDFVTAVLNNDGQNNFALEGGNAQSGPLTTYWNGSLPAGYSPMQQEGAVIMGTGGDNSHSDYGSFFEGAMTIGYPTGPADFLIQQNIVQASYTGNSGAVAGLRPPAGTVTTASGMCVDVLGDDTGTDMTPVDLWDCQPTAVDQHWTQNANGSLETLGRCLSVSTAAGIAGQGTAVAGDHAVLYDCNNSGVEQWVARPDGTLYNPPSGLCLYGQPSDGYQLQVVSCDSSDQDQSFSVNGGSPVTNVASGKCIDVLGDDTGGDFAPVDLWDCQQTAVDQHWYYVGGQLVTLGMCLTVSTAIGTAGSGTAAVGDHTVLYGCNNSGVQQWEPGPGGTLENPASGLCLWGQPDDGYQLQVTTCDPTDPGQRFAFAGAGTGVLGPPAGTITTAATNLMCVDVLGNDTGTAGTPVDEWSCDPYAVDQHWTHNADGSLETLGLCLSISTAQGVQGTGPVATGDHVILWTCDGDALEQWVQQPDGTLQNPGSGLCLYGQPSDGYQLLLQDCDSGDVDQQFSVNGGSPITLPGHRSTCIDVLGDDNGTNGTPVDLWDCQQTAADQHWYYNSGIKALQTLGKCLDISVALGVGGTGTAVAGDHTTLWDCNGSGVEQWVPRPDGSLYNPPSGLCLDIPGGTTTNGWQLDVQPCGDLDLNQEFSFYSPGSPFVNEATGNCIDVLGDDAGGDLAPVDGWSCIPTAADQHWTYASDDTLQTMDKCLSISTATGVAGEGTGSAGNHVVLWPCNGSGVEQWIYLDNYFYNPGSELCLTVPEGNAANGWQLDVESCTADNPDQQFY